MPIRRSKQFTTLFTSVAATMLLSLCTNANAGMIAYQNSAAFDLATSGWSTKVTTDFESSLVGTSYGPGQGPSGAGFSLALSGPDVPDFKPTVSNQFWTTSGMHYLGLDNGDTAFEAGDALTFTFANGITAFGLYVIGTADIGAGDITLTAGGYTVANGAVAERKDGAGSFAYFIGVSSDDGSRFTSITLNDLTSLDPRLLNIAIDDVTLARNDPAPSVPEPATLWLLLIGVPLISAISRRQAR